jgi:hypothetical protein
VYNSKGIVYASSKHSLGIVGEAWLSCTSVINIV